MKSLQKQSVQETDLSESSADRANTLTRMGGTMGNAAAVEDMNTAQKEGDTSQSESPLDVEAGPSLTLVEQRKPVEKEPEEDEEQAAEPSKEDAQLEDAGGDEEDGEGDPEGNVDIEPEAEAAPAEPAPPPPTAPVANPTVVPPSAPPQPTSVIMPEPAHDPIVTKIWTESTGMSPSDTHAHAQSRFSNLDALASVGRAELDMNVDTLSAQIDAAISIRIGTIDSAIASAKEQVRSSFAEAKLQTASEFDAAAATISQQTNANLMTIDSVVAQSMSTSQAGIDQAITGLDPTRSQLLANLSGAWDQRVEAIRQAGEARANTVIAKRKALQSGWQGGDGQFERDKNEARRDAATEVASKYAADIRDRANQAANELAAGKNNLSEMVSGLIDPIGQQLVDQKTEVVLGLSSMGESAKNAVVEAESNLLDSCQDFKGQVAGQLDDQEQASLQALEDAGQASRESLLAAGDELKAQLLSAANEFSTIYTDGMAQMQAFLAEEGDIPNSEDVDAACDQMEIDLEETRLEQLQAMQSAFNGGMMQLDTVVNDALINIQAAQQSISDGLASTVAEISGHVQSLSTIHLDSLNQLNGQVEGSLGEASQQTITAANECVATTAMNVADPESQLLSELDSGRDALIADLDSAVVKSESEMRSQAETAASKVKKKKWYHKLFNAFVSVVSFLAEIVVYIVVFVAVTALVIGMIGSGGILAMILAGAVAGGIAAVAGKFAGEATKSLLTRSNQFSSLKEYGKTLFVGTLSGALSGGLAGWGNAVMKAGVNSMGFATFSQIGDVLILGESWSWGELFFTGAFAFGLGQAAKKLGSSKLGDWTLKRVFPKHGNAWNGFQSLASRAPILRGLTTAQRGIVWKNFAKGKIKGGSFKFLKKLFQPSIKKPVEEFLSIDKGKPSETEDQDEVESESATASSSGS